MNAPIQQVVILGSTGSIGLNTLEVIQKQPDKFQVFALTAHKNISLLTQQISLFQPKFVVVTCQHAHQKLHAELREQGNITPVLFGHESIIELVSHPEVDIVVGGLVGAVGLMPLITAAIHGKRILLANKEPLVMAGELFIHALKEGGGVLLPVDSEHNAIFQVMPRDFTIGRKPEGVTKIILTASGGPFLKTPIEQLDKVTPAQATLHPVWKMGKKISVDSATLMNKALEVIEAHFLFNLPGKDIDVLIHPQSTVHSMVCYEDGSMLAQLGMPDMRTPIAYCLGWPARIKSGVETLDLTKIRALEFFEVDHKRFPSIPLAYEMIKKGNVWPAIFNAANEVVVAAFLEQKIKFTEIIDCIHKTLEAMDKSIDITWSGERLSLNDLEWLLHIDNLARLTARNIMQEKVQVKIN
jgi:1-deoxy-D-xylulose-5-phosphate reductoisomerase